MSIFYLLVLLNIENHNVEKCKHESVTNLTHVSKIGLNLHNFQTTGIFKISSFGNFAMVVLCYKALIACDKQWQKVYMPIRSRYTTWLPWRTILFCKHMHGFCTDYSGIATKLMSSQRTIFNVCVCNVLGRLWAQAGHPGRISETSLPFVAQSVYFFSNICLHNLSMREIPHERSLLFVF